MQSPFRSVLRSLVARPSNRFLHSTVRSSQTAASTSAQSANVQSNDAGETPAAESSGAAPRAAKPMNAVPLDMDEFSMPETPTITLPPGIKGVSPPQASSSSSRGPNQRQFQQRDRPPHLNGGGNRRGGQGGPRGGDRQRQQPSFQADRASSQQGQGQYANRFGPGAQGQRSRQQRGDGQGGAGGPRGNGRPGQGAGPRSDRQSRQRTERRTADSGAGTSVSKAIGTRSSGPPPEAQVEVDRSFGGIFGKTSLVQPQPAGVRNAEASPRMAGLDDAAKRKAIVHGMAGSYDLLLPQTPAPSKLPSSATPQQRALSQAEWAMAFNKTVSLQAALPARPVLEKYLGSSK